MLQSSRVTFTKSNSYCVSSLHKVKTGFHLPLQSGFTPCSPSNLYCSHMIILFLYICHDASRYQKITFTNIAFLPFFHLLICYSSFRAQLRWYFHREDFIEFGVRSVSQFSSTVYLFYNICGSWNSPLFSVIILYKSVFSSREDSVQFSSVQSLSHVQLFATPWTAAREASLPITNCQSLLKLISIESMIPSNHLILCCLLLLPPSIFPSIRNFSMSQFFASGGRRIGVSASASVLKMSNRD